MLKFNYSFLMIYSKVLKVVSLHFMDSEILGFAVNQNSFIDECLINPVNNHLQKFMLHY